MPVSLICDHCQTVYEGNPNRCSSCGRSPSEASSSPLDAHRDGVSTITLHPFEPGQLVMAKLILEVVEGLDAGRRVLVETGRAVIGAEATADLPLSDPAVSRRHMEVRTVTDGVLLIDLNSRNGTFVDGALIRQMILPKGASIRLGTATRIRIHTELQNVAQPTLSEAFAGYTTAHPPLQATLGLLDRVSREHGTVLIEGETGTGKDILAQGIHQASPRKDGPFVIVDCRTAERVAHQLNDPLAETSAFQRADGGTLCLDEIGELPVELQSSLLQAIEQCAYDVRFVATTHHNLPQMMAKESFRQDLYYRLAVIRVQVPPLRDRPEDVPLLAERFVEELGEGRKFLSPLALLSLAQQMWPGNVRELRNTLAQAVTIAESETIHPEDLSGRKKSAPKTFWEAKKMALSAFEQRYAQALLEQHNGNVSRAAKEAGMSRPTFYALMKRGS